MLLLGLVCLAAFALRVQGINWPRFHPDETPIASWIESGRPARLYPGGYFTLIAPARAVAQASVTTWNRIQNFAGYVHSHTPQPLDFVLLARWFNVLLAILTCLVVQRLGARCVGIKGAGILVATLVGFSAYHIEHCHYAETDIAMVFTLALALLLWARAADAPGRWRMAAAGLALGFAAGTKFILVLALLPFLVFCVTAKPASPRRWPAVAAWTFLALASAAVGFLIANPEAQHARRFFAAFGPETDRVLHETLLNLREHAGNARVRWMAHLVILADGFRAMGGGWLALSAAGACCALTERYRRFWTCTLLFPAAYVSYWIFLAPWVRGQEFLNLVPVVALLAGLGAGTLLRSRSLWVRRGAVVLVCATVLESACVGLHASSFFGWQDRRIEALQWMNQHEPADIRIARERYVKTVPGTMHGPGGALESRNAAFDLQTVEEYGVGDLLEENCDYLIRNASVDGRGLSHPVTGELYPQYQSHLDRFVASAERIRAWELLPSPSVPDNFHSMDVELWSLRKAPDVPPLGLTVAQPARIARSDHATFFPVGHALGSAHAIPVTSTTQRLGVGGLPGSEAPFYVVLSTKDAGADVIVTGFARRHRVRLEPHDARVIPLIRSRWRPRIANLEVVQFRAVGNHPPASDCLLQGVFTAPEAASLLAAYGRADRALEFARATPGLQTDALLLYRLAVEAEQWGEAERHRNAARELAGRVAAVLESDANEFRMGTIAAKDYDDFARLRFADPAAEGRLLEIRAERRADASSRPEFKLPLAARLPAGDYRLVCELKVLHSRAPEGAPTEVEVTVAGEEPASPCGRLELTSSPEFTRVVLPFRFGKAGVPTLVFHSGGEVIARCRSLSVEWTARSRLAAEYDRWQRAASLDAARSVSRQACAMR